MEQTLHIKIGLWLLQDVLGHALLLLLPLNSVNIILIVVGAIFIASIRKELLVLGLTAHDEFQSLLGTHLLVHLGDRLFTLNWESLLSKVPLVGDPREWVLLRAIAWVALIGCTVLVAILKGSTLLKSMGGSLPLVVPGWSERLAIEAHGQQLLLMGMHTLVRPAIGHGFVALEWVVVGHAWVG